MPLLILGFALVFAGLFGWSLAAPLNPLSGEPGVASSLLVCLLLAPTLAAWIAAEVVHLVSPRRAFDPRRSTRALRLALGFAAGLCSAAAAAAVLPWADRALPDPATFGLVSMLVMGGAVCLTSRCRPGHCVHCCYDLRQSPAPGRPGAGRCPECGAGIDPFPVGSATVVPVT